MERATGFEPATSTLARLRATNCAKPASQELLYATLAKDASTFLKKIGAILRIDAKTYVEQVFCV